jgi:hypothetical protein
MKDLLKDAQDATLRGFSRTLDLVRDYPEPEQPEAYKTASSLLYMAHDLLTKRTSDDGGYRWRKIKEFMERKENA